MATHQAHNGIENPAVSQSNGNGPIYHDFVTATQHMSHEEKQKATQAARFGYGPLARFHTTESSMLPGEPTMKQCPGLST